MIERGALVVVNSSSGKDSRAMTNRLSRFVSREQLLVAHAPLGEVEWPGTIEHIEQNMLAGVPLQAHRRGVRAPPLVGRARPGSDRYEGRNVLGRLWMELRQQLRDGDPAGRSGA